MSMVPRTNPDIEQQLTRFAPSQSPQEPSLDSVAKVVAGTIDVPVVQQPFADMPPLPGEAPADDAIQNAARSVANERRQSVTSSLAFALQVDPNLAAEADALGRRFGVGQDVALRNMDELRNRAKVEDANVAELVKFDPVLARMLANPAFASQASDDIGVLSLVNGIKNELKQLVPPAPEYELELNPYSYGTYAGKAVGHVASEFRDIVRSGWERGWAVSQRGDIGVKTMFGLEHENDLIAAEYLRQRMQELGQLGLIGATTEMIAQQVAQAKTIGAMSVGGAAVGFVAAGPPGAATGGFLGLQAGIVASTGAMEGGNLYLDLRDAGVDDDVAIPVSIGAGFLNGLIELATFKIAAAPFKKLLNTLVKQELTKQLTKATGVAAVKAAGRAYGLQVLGNATQEGLQELNVVIAEEVAKALEGIHSETTLESAANRIVEAFLYGGMATALLGGIGPGANLIVDLQRANATKLEQTALSALERNKEESNLAERNMPAYLRFLAAQLNGSPADTIYVDAQVAADVLEKNNITLAQLEQVLPGISERFQKAFDTKSDLTISTAEYVAKVSGTTLGDALRPHIRLSAMSMSVADAQKFEAKRAATVEEAKRLLAEQQATNEQFEAEAQQVEQQAFDELMAVGKFTEVEARAAAKFRQASVIVDAVAQGMTPMEWQMKYGKPLSVQGDGTQAVVPPLERADQFDQVSVNAQRRQLEQMEQRLSDELVDAEEEWRNAKDARDDSTNDAEWEAANQRVKDAKDRQRDLEGQLEQIQIQLSELPEKPIIFEQAARIDADYLAAVERGDMETGQRMVDEAARAAGYETKVFHGTDRTFNRFASKYIFTTDSERLAREYGELAADQSGRSPVVQALVVRMSKPFDVTTKRGLKNAQTQIALWAKSSRASWVSALGDPAKADAYTLQEFLNPRDGSRALIDKVFAEYDGIVTPSVESGAKEFLVRDPSQVKRADPVTYDESGKVVPLSRRFDITSPKVFEQAAMATRVPSAVKPLENALEEVLLADYPTFLRDAQFVAKNLAKFKQLKAPIRIDETLTEQEQIEQIIEHMTGNLLWLHDVMDSNIRERAKMWYVGGRRLVDWLAERHGLSPMQAATVFAVLSPQKNWYENVGLGIRISDIVATQGTTTMDADMQDAYLSSLRKEVAKQTKKLITHNAKKPEPDAPTFADWKLKQTEMADALKAAEEKVQDAQGNIDAIGTRTLAQLLAEREFFLSAIMVRWFDQTKNDRTYPVISPEGGVGSPMLTEVGEPANIRYGSYNEVAKAIAAYVDGRAENVHYLIGAEHKVRNFYNNLFNPDDPRFATIDTHAIAAAYLMPLAGTDALTSHGLGSGVGNAMFGLGGGYAVFFEAYRRAAAQRGIAPREMQSITWEAIRGMFEAAMKGGLKAPVADIWKRYVDGTIDINTARAEVMQRAGGITTPSWVALPTNMQPNAGYEGTSRVAADAQAKNIQGQPMAASVMFEVAPDPADVALVKQWESVTPELRQEISIRVAETIVPRVLQEFGIAADMVMQVGGWKGSTNVGFALRMRPSPLVRQVAQAIGQALSQEAVFSLSDTQFNGSQQAGVIVLSLQPGTPLADIADLYETKLWPLGIQGHATVADRMVIVLEPGVDAAKLSATISSSLVGDSRVLDVAHDVAWSSLDETRITEAAARAPDAKRRTKGAIERRRIDVYRSEATRLVGQYLAEATGFQQAARGDFDPAKLMTTLREGRDVIVDGTKFDQAPVSPSFYSALAKAVDSIDAKSMLPSGWKERIKGLVNKGEVKQDEVDWSGLTDWLNMQDGKVTKEAVAEFLTNNGVRVERVQLGREELEVLQEKYDNALNEFAEARRALKEIDSADKAAYDKAMARVNAAHELTYRLEVKIELAESNTLPRYEGGKFTTPGGENYREVLVTLPSPTSRLSEAHAMAWRKYGQGSPQEQEAQRRLDEAPGDSEGFRSPHWDQPNVLVHFRLNDRVDADGKRVLFVEEMQSDWGQAGRKQGFRGAVPLAPFVETTDGWLNLALKHILLEATQGNYDRVAFVNGRQSADRYDLSKQVEQISWDELTDSGRLDYGAPSATKVVTIRPIRGNLIDIPIDARGIAVATGTTGNQFDGKPLDEIVPKEIAEQIMAERSGDIRGDGLKVGGNGMLEFYDKIVPAAVNKLLKKYGGGKLGAVVISDIREKFRSGTIEFGSEEEVEDFLTEISSLGFEEEDYGRIDDTMSVGFENLNSGTFNSFRNASEVYNGTIKVTSVNEASANPEHQQQLGFSITPELIKSLEFGLPLFQAQRESSQPRGGIDPRTLNIIVGKGGDVSTLVHEMMHLRIGEYLRMASSGMATATVMADLDILFNFMGVEGATFQERLENYKTMPLEQRKPLEEKVTYNFEIYVYEGKAPSVELRGVFARLAMWMRRVYKSIRDDLNAIYRREFGADLPILTPEVRGVFDRMLATEEQIRRQEAVNGMKGLFQTKDEAIAAGMSEAEWAAYQDMQQEATNDAVAQLSAATMRQMQWMSNARARILRDLQKQHAAKRKEVAAEVSAAIKVTPVYRAMTYLRLGRFVDTDGQEADMGKPHRLDIDQVNAMYASMPEAARPDIKALGTGKNGMLEKGGLSPDMVAELFGYSSGDEMIRAMLAAKPMKDAVAERTDEVMVARYSDMNSPAAVEAEVQKALRNEARARLVAVELRFLAKATQPVRVILEAARQVAADIIEGTVIREVRPNQYMVAEARSARDADRIQRTYDITEPAEELVQRYGKDRALALVRAKQAQLYQNQLAAEALRVKDYVDKQVKYLRRVLRDENVKRMGAAAADQIAGLLERFEVVSVSLKRLDERRTMAKYLADLEAAGMVPDIAENIADEARRVNYRQMKVSEFRDLVDAVRQIEHVGKNEQKMRLAEERAAFAEKRDEIVTRIREVGKERELQIDPRTPLTGIGRTAAFLRGFAAQHLKAASIARILDGGKEDGPLWNAIIRTANDASDMETRMRAEACLKLSEILKPVFALGGMGGKGMFFPSINRSLNREARIAIALNLGNDGNRQRLLDGEGWTIEQLQPVLESLTEAEWLAVQQVWDFIDGYRPEIAAKERRLYGKEPEWVKPVPFTVRTLDGKEVALQGGYYPVKYDPVASDRVATVDAAEEAKRDLQGAYTAATTRRSFVKARAKEVVDRPILYTLDAAFSGVNDVIHDLAWHEWLISTNRLLRDVKFANAVRETRGPEFLKQLRDWTKDNATGARGQQAAGESVLSWLRQGISASGLGFNVVSAAMQVTGFNQSIVRVGAKYIGQGIVQFSTSPFESAKTVAEKSSFMAERGRTQFREINEIKNRVRGQTEVARRVTAGTYFLMMNMQRSVDIPTWLGAYQKALDAGKDDAKAVALADQAVRDSQGSGLVSDLSAIERGGPLMKLFTVFYSYMNTVYNMTAVQTMTARSRGKLAADYAMLLVVPVVLGYAIKSAIQPDADDDELDPEALARKLAAEELSYLMGTMVIVREFGGAAQLLTGAEGVRMGYGGPAGLRAVGEVYGLATQAGQLEFDRAFRRAAINTLGAFTGLPSAQINRTIDGIEALIEGEVEGPTAVLAPLTGVQR